MKKKLTAEEKFNLKMDKFLKMSREILKDATHKKHTQHEERQAKNKINTARKLKNKNRNN